MREPDAPKARWICSFPASPPAKEGLARIVDADGGRDDAENSYAEGTLVRLCLRFVVHLAKFLIQAPRPVALTLLPLRARIWLRRSCHRVPLMILMAAPGYAGPPRRARMTDDELMRRTKLSRHAAAKNASLLLVQDALVQIRAMAYLRREVAARQDESPLDYHEHIRLIAGACENLPGYLRTNTPIQGLKYAWKQANQMQQAWLRETLAQHGIAITDLVDN